MKQILIALFLIIGIHAHAQEGTQSELQNTEPIFTCDLVKISDDTETLEFIGNVSFTTDIITLKDAEKVVLNKNTNELTITGTGDFTIDGAIQVANQGKAKTIRYTLSERVAYLE